MSSPTPVRRGRPHVEETKAAQKVSRMRRFVEAPIRIWQPMKDDQPFIAMIDGLEFVFRDASPMRASMKADAWRRTEYDRMVTKEQRLADNLALGAGVAE